MFASARQPVMAGVFALLGLGFAACGSAEAGRLSMNINGFTNAPVGYSAFCAISPAECSAHGGEAAEALTDARWNDLQEINGFVNHIVIPETDQAQFNREEVWSLPEIYGDCEDYVLLKRKWLLERGWPTGALLISVVFDEAGDGHAVLLARTDRGDFVLDNKTTKIKPWYETEYRYVKRQSVRDPNRWVSLGDPRWTARTTAAPR